jgi:integrase
MSTDLSKKSNIRTNSASNSGQLDASSVVPAGATVSLSSSFSDRVWDMMSLITCPGIKKAQWDFSLVPGFPGGFALGLAEYAYHRLYIPATHEHHGAWLTVANELVILRTFAKFCDRHGCLDFSEVDQDLCNQFLLEISHGNEETRKKSHNRVREIIRCLYRLWEYSLKLSRPLPEQPFQVPLKKLFKSNCRERAEENINKTPCIPEEIFGPLTKAALDYVLNYSETILEAWGRVRKSWNDIAKLSLTSRTKTRRLGHSASVVTKAIETPWRIKQWDGLQEIYNELHQLRQACNIVVLAFSGVRASEFLALETDAHVTDISAGVTRHYLESIIYKNRESGARERWVIIEEVAKALKVLELLTEPARAATGVKLLNLSDDKNDLFSVRKEFSEAAFKTLTSPSLGYQINTFANRCNRLLNRPPIPNWKDTTGAEQEWRFNPRQFRRTLARYIARQPFGLIAGMLQYKHVEVSVFEGYAGSEPEWNKILNEEKALASIDLLQELALDMSHGEVAGTFASRINSDFEREFRGRAEDFPPSQIVKWLANQSKPLFVGKFNFCFFDPTKALCTRQLDRKDLPVLNSCDPSNCANSCVSKRHAPVWRAQLEQAEELLRNPKTSNFQSHVLRNEVQELNRVLTDLTEV